MMHLAMDVVSHPRFATRQNDYVRWYPKALVPAPQEVGWTNDPVGGAYVHVPFCDRICRFCPFNKTLTRQSSVEGFVAALLREVELLGGSIAAGPLRFVYFGGGTPSVLDPAQVEAVLAALDATWGLAADTEVTLETHPTHATEERLRGFAAAGVTRVSMGIQSFRQDLLAALGAGHTDEDSRAAVRSARRVFEHFAIDLLYHYPAQTRDAWGDDLRLALGEWEVPHLSCYALVPTGRKPRGFSPALEVEFAAAALEAGEQYGLAHYASCASGGFDLAQKGHRCRYEQEHWSAPQTDFVGLGPGALGFAGGHLTVNRLGVEPYAAVLGSGRLPLASARRVEEAESRHRYFVLGVKALEVPLGPYRECFGREPLDDFALPLRNLEEEGLVTVERDTVRLTPVGRLFVDVCSAAFFSSAENAVPHPEEPQIRALERLVA
jgi:oxygen-independent coproporphyrinogen-3 oxidase